ncbi:hypothetical protein DSO57_1005487 [Entomophthora muscae]|uniref:Uncharacterized protein n=1 Tax=Entomophthora muscae TaxID=34485 RepID=A0ACC2U5Q8_9FUNG|nr:hypothetical protein DSO57_1005487 [Entomophthora muscae]
MPKYSTRIGLTQSQLDGAKELFAMFDKDGDGKILASEIENLLSQLGQTPSKEQVDALLEDSDLDKNGHIDFEEFLKVTAHKLIDLGDSHDLESNRKAFDQFDLDKDGFINREELFRALGVINPTLTEEDRIRMLEKFRC